MRMPQVSAIERLMGLPDVFRGADLTIRFQWSSKQASQYLYLWRQRRLVAGLGGHSDVFVNLLKGDNPDWGKAVRVAMPSAMTIGLDALRLAGWSTQIPQRPTLAVNNREPYYATEPYDIALRTPGWFNSVRPGVHPHPVHGLPVLKPAWALADLLCHGGWENSGLWPDDIDWDYLTPEDIADWSAARDILKVESNDAHLEDTPLADRRSVRLQP